MYNDHMAIQKILTVPEPLLRQKSRPVTKIDKKILEVIQDLKDTLAAQENPRGVGISAPQIGELWRICLIFSKKSKRLLILINPEIIWKSKKIVYAVPESKNPLEGCLSVPGYWGSVKRHKRVKVRYLSPNNQIVVRRFSGFTSTIFQHEYDHLEGILFIDRILEQGEKIYKQEKDKEGKNVLTEVEII
jgi:peptide deformylase